ncbi:U2 snRNP-associated SURP motif-containing protein [Condylostylus longicornis]|uniref:U2 snRNP-associated SURP motif-containing protein n=1 Tax=Condylostylus longicornis TaxID=2530218 RepID=UPI00244DB567|nr:U2 snRNP-associated SURP motif-containing protein [Condylostylus longicornis]
MSAKKIAEQKLQAFAIGAMGIKKAFTRKEQEELRKKEEEELAAHAFKEFVETFQEAPTASSKIWVKAGTYDAGSRKEDNREKGKLYKPGSKLSDDKSSADKAQEYAKMLSSEAKKENLTLKKKVQEKKKSNLELFKEELRQIQEEREERHKYKHMAKHVAQTHDVESNKETAESGSFDNGDPNTTNLYLGNLNPKISEQQLMELFGKYGPLASIKIMWPRSEEERSRGRNCGFVAYMNRKDAERALKTLNGRDVMGYEMRLGWGKSVPILSFPIYVPPALLEYTMPPPPSGLPFNAQPAAADINNVPGGNYKEYIDDEEKKEQMEKILYNSVIKVVVPNEKPLLCLIHRMIEFVIREGPMFEAMVMSKEMENPMFTFLFDNESPAHIYYRWKLFSLLQGDTPTEWKEKEFRMFKGGSIWKPPAVNFYMQGMPEELIVDEEGSEMNKGALSNAQRDRLEDLIRYLTPERNKIGDAMIFCIEHAEAADEICECIAESLSNPSTLMSKKIARLYLISDILHNCTVKVSNASFFRKSMEKNLVDIFKDIHSYNMSIESRLKGEAFKSRVLNVISAWEDWTVYPKEFLSNLKSIFLGKQNVEKTEVESAPLSGDEKEDEELDGIPLDGAALLKSAMLRGLPQESIKSASPTRIQEQSRDMDYDEDDIDGVPLEEDIDGVPLEDNSDSKNKTGGFIPSKWETVDPEQVEAQAITTSKWDTLDPVAPEPPKFYDSDERSEDNLEKHDEEKRTKLREIEVKIMQYQDELESGQRELKTGWSMSQQIDHYRRKLLKKEQKVVREEIYDSPKISKRSPSPSESITSKKSKRSKRSPSNYSSERTSSPVPRNKRRSRSPYSTKYRDSSPISNRIKPKRNRSRSESESPKRYREISPSDVYLKSSKYDASPRAQRSPSPSRLSSSRKSHGTEYRRETSPKYKSSSPARYKNDRHKHKHKR